ncbi:MAG: methanogenesis marker protein Mmp4/MtxX [Promethearchaeota archaeon]|jgi:putative methanogen marker protein 4
MKDKPLPLLKKFESLAKGKIFDVGIGLGSSVIHNVKILKVSIKFSEDRSSKIYLFGSDIAVHNLDEKIPSKHKSNLILVKSQEPERTIFEYLAQNKIQAVIRGSLSSNKFLFNLKKSFAIEMVYRLALLETVNGYQFFYGPVGIDECNSVESKIEFLENVVRKFKSLDIELKISILSGGRQGDLGRDSYIDKSIRNGEETVAIMKKHFPRLNINHDQILIENAIQNKSNMILAPDGISGNLIYRTLVHLGGGNAYGALYMFSEENLDNKVIIDTSRVGKIAEIEGAFVLALALL